MFNTGELFAPPNPLASTASMFFQTSRLRSGPAAEAAYIKDIFPFLVEEGGGLDEVAPEADEEGAEETFLVA